MSVPNTELERAVSAARVYEQQGYFEKVRAGDQKAASLFVKLVALDLNPKGDPTGWGWLTKSPGETQVDGFAEDAICWTNDPANRVNAVDMVNGAGAPGASIGGSVKERRENNKWYKPEPLTMYELAYLRPSGQPPTPQPPPTPAYPSYESLGGDAGGIAITRQLEADYKRAGKPGLDGDCGAWQQRVSYDFLTGICKTVQESITKHRKEWCDALGIPVQ